MPTTLFVDESLKRGFRFVGVAVDTSQVGRARATMRAMLPRGARRIHFVKENDVRRRRVLAEIAQLDLTILIVDVTRGGRSVDRRHAALGRLVVWALDSGIDRLVFERDENSVLSDLRTIARVLDRLGRHGAFEYGHMPASMEPILWIADALAWSWSRGSSWRRSLEERGICVEVHSVP